MHSTLANTDEGKFGLRCATTKSLEEDCSVLCKNRFEYAWNDYWCAGYALAPHCIDVNHNEADPEVLLGLERVCNRLFYDDVKLLSSKTTVFE